MTPSFELLRIKQEDRSWLKAVLTSPDIKSPLNPQHRTFATACLLPFRLGFGSDTDMEPNLQAIIRRALAEARAEGKDYLTQTEETVRAVLQAFPEMNPSQALAQVNRVRRD
jgi:hypothetical protein